MPAIGKLHSKIPPETRKSEFIDSGQVYVPEIINSKGAPVPEEKEKEEKCFCNRDFTVDEVKKFVKEMRDAEKIKTYALFGEENCPVRTEDKTYEKLCSELNVILPKNKNI